jgi:acyl-coenzyme A thioesterase 9
MASLSRPLKVLLISGCRRARLNQQPVSILSRCIHSTALNRTDGVFRGLTDERLPTPWIEAFRNQQHVKGNDVSKAQPQERDLSPRKMRDSYHRIVLPLGQDPWLSDTYINVSGHIRYGQTV